MRRVVLSLPLALAACSFDSTPAAGPEDFAEPKQTHYSPPSASGLREVRPFPNVDDVCRVIGENALTNPYLDDAHLLVGCPRHAMDAIGDRMSEGGRIVAHVGHWTLISMPLRSGS